MKEQLILSIKNPPADLEDYAMGWVERDPKRKDYEWPKSVSVIDLIYGLVHFFPELHDDPEGQVYLEVFTRQLGACEQVLVNSKEDWCVIH